MKVIVLKEFIDKHTGKLYKPKDAMTVSENRFEEIQKQGNYVMKVMDEGKEGKK